MKIFNQFSLPILRPLMAAGFSAAASLVFVGCSQSVSETATTAETDHAPLLAHLDEYEAKMAELIVELRESEDVEALDAATRELVELSLPIVDGFMQVYPDCTEYLSASKAVVEEMNHLSADEIEQNYHLDAALPEGDSKCYHVKDLLVHPATVVVLLRGDLEENREQMTLEIVENQAHLDLVRSYLTDNES